MTLASALKRKLFPRSVGKAEKITQETSLSSSSLADLGYEIKNTQSAFPTHTQSTLDLSNPSELLMVYLTAPQDHPFVGYELIQALLAAGLRYGAMGLFHCYDDEGQILFSVAQTTQSGAFDLDNMGDIVCRGLILFMKQHHDTTKLYEVATQLAEELGGKIENKSIKANQ